MTRSAYFAAPALMFGYGVVRLIDGLDGSHGPGPAWMIGHLMFLAALVFFGMVLIGVHRAAPRYRAAATVAVAGGLAGLLAFIRVVIVDLIVAWGAADRAEMNRRYDEYENFPGLPGGVEALAQDVAPVLFPLSLIVLTGLLAALRPRRLPWWSPLATAAGFAAIIANLDLLPVGGALLTLALLPMTRSRIGSTSPGKIRTSGTLPAGERQQEAAGQDGGVAVRML